MTGEGAMVEIRPQVFAFEEQMGEYRHRFEAPTIADLVALRAAFEAAKPAGPMISDAAKPAAVAGNWTPLKAGADYSPLAEVTLTAKPWLFGPPKITAEMEADISPNLPVPNLADYLDLSRHDSADTPTVVGPS